MSPRFLLDTNAISEVIRPQPSEHFLGRFMAHRGEMAISAITLSELRYGIQRLPQSRRQQQLDTFLQNLTTTLPILPVDSAAGDWHGRERAWLEGAGQTRPWADGLIAAVAATRSLILVTRNIRDFIGYQELIVQDWTLPP